MLYTFTPLAIPVTVMVNVVPSILGVDSTVTSLVVFRAPVATSVSSSFMDMLPAVPENPPNRAVNAVIIFFSGRDMVKVMLVAGFLFDPTCEYVGCWLKDGFAVTVLMVQVLPRLSSADTFSESIFTFPVPNMMVPSSAWM